LQEEHPKQLDPPPNRNDECSEMLTKLLIYLCSISPFARRKLWHWWYQRWARQVDSGAWTFMNYGLAWPAGEQAPDLLPADEPDRYCAQLYHRVAAPGQLRGKLVLEVGAGRGGGAAFVALYHHPLQLTAVDFSPRAIAFCKARHRLPQLRFEEGDAEKLPLADASFDAVINVESSHCYGSVPQFLAEVTRVLKPGGCFLFADLREAPEMQSLHAQLADLPGMEVVESEDLTTLVAAALTADHPRKYALIDSLVPQAQRAMFREFAGIEGSTIHRNLSSGVLLYHRWMLRRTV
jgi:ubiquinone/menaquinone biosynthesis C-methylase UbiE